LGGATVCPNRLAEASAPRSAKDNGLMCLRSETAYHMPHSAKRCSPGASRPTRLAVRRDGRKKAYPQCGQLKHGEGRGCEQSSLRVGNIPS
jgi:hypothetical protein